jgi:hypothetical protein
MKIQSMMLTFAVTVAGMAAAAADPAGGATKNTGGGGGGGGFVCTNGVGVGCIGSIATLPITINVGNVSALNGNYLTILSDDLNDLSILDGNILDHNQILDDVYATVLSDFLDKFGINVSGNDVGICTNVLGLQLCK